MLRFIGVSAENATRLSRAHGGRARVGDKASTPSAALLDANPLDAQLRAELAAYFAPFEAQLRRITAAHQKCAADRTSAARARLKKSSTTQHALARAGR